MADKLENSFPLGEAADVKPVTRMLVLMTKIASLSESASVLHVMALDPKTAEQMDSISCVLISFVCFKKLNISMIHKLFMKF